MEHNVRLELEIVRKMKKLLDSPEKWTKGATAKNSRGEIISSRDKDAICWCLVGATRRCDPNFHFLTYEIFSPVMEGFVKTVSIPIWNDAPERTYEDIVELLNKTEEYYTAN